MVDELKIRPVSGRRDLKGLFALPRQIHRQDPMWISPLDFERSRQWSDHNPWFDHGRARAWLAETRSGVVGSISAQIDRLHQEIHGQACGYFGSLEFEPSVPELPEKLLQVAAEWLEEQGMDSMRGPFDLAINQSCGLLVEGFDTPPMVMMGHHPPRYSQTLDDLGLARAMDLEAWIVPPEFPAPLAMERLLERNRSRILVRPIRRNFFAEDLEILRGLFNDAWSENWGFVPFTREEFQAMGEDLRRILPMNYIQIAELDGQPAAFIVALPNINELIADLDGRLLPLGWLKFLWRLKTGRATTARVPLMGVSRAFQRGRMGSLLAFAVIDGVRWHLHRDGIKQVELSWILETNKGMSRIIESLGACCYKRYRIYETGLPFVPGTGEKSSG